MLEHELVDLRHMDGALVDAVVDRPNALPRPAEDELRYLLGFARLHRFEPGAAARGGRSGRGDVVVAPDLLAPFRVKVAAELGGALLHEDDPGDRLRLAAAALERLRPELRRLRQAVIARHAGEFSVEELDDEAGRRTLALVVGGGGGAGWVYPGAFERLEEEGIVPAYVLGASMGALLGLLRAREARTDWEAYLSIARRLPKSQIFRPMTWMPRHGLPALLRLSLAPAIGPLFQDGGGRRMRLSDLGIPYEVVVAGVRRRVSEQLPEPFTHPERLPSPRTFAGAIAERMWRVTAFFSRRIVREIVLGADPLTASFDAVDAAGFSAAIPGVLYYDADPEDEPMQALLDELFAREEISALVDGGVANNVPSQTAWRRVQDGCLGTRNAVIVAFDCFHPQWDPAHLWLQPITQAVQLQMARNEPFADRVIRFGPTLSPLNLLPPARQIDQAADWGRQQIEVELPRLRRLLDPVRPPAG